MCNILWKWSILLVWVCVNNTLQYREQVTKCLLLLLLNIPQQKEAIGIFDRAPTFYHYYSLVDLHHVHRRGLPWLKRDLQENRRNRQPAKTLTTRNLPVLFNSEFLSLNFQAKDVGYVSLSLVETPATLTGCDPIGIFRKLSCCSDFHVDEFASTKKLFKEVNCRSGDLGGFSGNFIATKRSSYSLARTRDGGLESA